MKRVFLILILNFVLFSCGEKLSHQTNKVKQNVSNHEVKNDSLYEVYKIDSVNIFYIVYARKNNTNFKIISKKTGLINCDKVLVDYYYNLKLKSILRQEVKLGDKSFSSAGNLLVNCFTFEGNTEICREDGISDLYRAENLNGLCYTGY